jgi:hypothetical protein
MTSGPRRKRLWVALSVVYVLVLLGIGLWYVLTPGLAAEDKVIAGLGVSALPAMAFVAVVVPLLRGSENRVALVGGAALATLASFFQLMLTFGFALPLSAVLLGLAVSAFNRAARNSQMPASRRLVALGAVLALCLGIAPITVVVIVAAAVVWILSKACWRPRRSEGAPGQ